MQPNSQDSNQPAQPTPTPPVGNSSMGHVIQPLTSEAEIRQEIEAAPVRPEVVQPERPSPTPNANFSPLPSATHTVPTNAQGNPTAAPTYTTVQPQNTPITEPERRSGVRIAKIIALVVGVGIIAAIALSTYVYMYGGKIAVTDLTSETFQQTTFLKPRAWVEVPSINSSLVYTDRKKGDGKVNSFIAIKEAPVVQILVGANDSVYKPLRQALLEKTTISMVQPFFDRSEVPCEDKIKFSADIDEQVKGSTTGLLFMTASCTRADGVYMLKSRTVAGSVGHAHIIIIGASGRSWEMNQEALEAMLNSIRQADGASAITAYRGK